MIYFRLPNDDKMPALGLGTWQATDEELEKALNHALGLGYRHIDTAHVYENEKLIGRVLNGAISSGRLTRAELFVTTKLPPKGMYPNMVESYLKDSLANLQLDYVDLYLIHSPNGIKEIQTGVTKDLQEDTTVDHIAIWKDLERQVELGRVKSIGVSNFSVDQIENILKHCKIRPANLQVEIHVYFQQKELVDYCRKKGISVVAYSPLGSPGLNNYYSTHGIKKDLPNLFENEVILRISKKHRKTPAQIILRFAVQRGIAAIPKSTSEERLRENIDIFDFHLDSEDMEELGLLDLGDKGQITNWEPWTWV